MLGKVFGFFKKEDPKDQFVPVVVRKDHVPVSAPKPKKVVKPTKSHYMCTSCGYRFTRGAGIEFNKICPYCGKQSVQKDDTADAQRLLDNTVEEEDSFFRR
jgi:predicted RNA-binding Zn-ribbon protein involved in translation (DUF1610 family)